MSQRAIIEAEFAALARLGSHINDRLMVLRKQQNAIAPINRLPAELTVDIMRRSATFGHAAATTRRLLSSVQTRWWHIIEDNGCFWNTISCTSTLEEVDLSLLKSGNTPLHIDVGEGTINYDLEAFMIAVEPYTDQWKTFSIAEGDFDTVKPYLEVPTPLLETLDATEYNADPRNPPHLNLVDAPRLIELDVWYIVVPFSSGIFPSLTTLRLHQITANGLTPQIIRCTLQSCPQLRELYLHNISASDPPLQSLPIPSVQPILHAHHRNNDVPCLRRSHIIPPSFYSYYG